MKEYFSISEAAKIAHVTSETLRHYDRIGLVKPGKKDEWTGYRYYSKEEVVRLGTIAALRCMDLSLKEIKHVLEYDNLEKIVAFLEETEKKADEKISELQYGKSRIQLAKADYEKKLHRRQEMGEVFTKEVPERIILLSETLQTPSLDNLWNYLSHFYGRAEAAGKKDLFEFEDLAGVYTDKNDCGMFAVCIRHTQIDGLKTLPGGTYLCAECAEETRTQAIELLKSTAKRQYDAEPEFTVELIIVTGILQWNYQVQIYLGK